MDKNNVYAAILAGGVGTRMGNVEKPKQFLNIGGKPIIVHTVEKFFSNDSVDNIIVLTPKQWVNHTKDLLAKYLPASDHIHVIEGGSDRNKTIMNAIQFIEDQYELNDETVIITHDSVRPFVSHRIITENVECMEKYDACDTAIAATDTIVKSDNNEYITEIPDRSLMYQGQTPQTFKAKKLKETYLALSEEEKQKLTDACKIMVLKGEKVYLVEGETSNMKVTYPYDLKVAEALLEE
ncbi:MAG: 2-C-methyl-D-erythritol 4-phosphate cytidylyltransferase [Eubacterium sp.]|nr:2-C-methyl-D-erythritol 4-phosphate cytidylyltransferase [Eubacterium sp.]